MLQSISPLDTKMLFTRILTSLLLLINSVFAVDLGVYRDTSCPNYIGDSDSVYLWSSVATFGQRPSNGQIVQLAEDAWLSMFKYVKTYNLSPNRLPKVMSALAYQNENNVWEIYFASSSKGSSSLVYNYGEATDSSCGDKWDTVPEELRNAIDTCARQSGEERHVFDAKCGEMNALLMLFMRTGQDVSQIAARSRIVAWQGNVDAAFEYSGGFIKRPCFQGGFGCSQVLSELSPGITVIPKNTQKESYFYNMPVSVDFQPLFPGY